MTKSKSASIPLSLCIAYSAPHLSMVWLMTPVAIIQGIYAKYYGLPLTTIAAILLIANLFDAISDPLIGYWSDMHYQRKGTRKPFVLLGALLFIISGYFLYVPPSDVTALYFTVCYIAFYLGWTICEVPHITWAGELSPNAADKTLIYSIRNMAGYAGLLCFYAIPLLPIFDSRAITPETLSFSVVAAGLLMVPLLIYSLKVAPNHHLSKNQRGTIGVIKASTPIKVSRYRNLRQTWKSMIHNVPFLLFIGAFSLGAIGSGMWYGLAFIFVDVYLQMGDQFAQLFLIAFAGGIAATPIWYKIANRVGKKSCWALAIVLLMICYIFTSTLTPEDTTFSQLLLLKVIQTLGFTCMGVMAPAMLSEICDYGAWKFGAERSGTYFSVYAFVAKIASSIASASGLAIAGWYGFDANATIQSDSGVKGLILAMTWIPLIFASLALALILISPINSRRHEIIQRRLTIRQKRIEQQNSEIQPTKKQGQVTNDHTQLA